MSLIVEDINGSAHTLSAKEYYLQYIAPITISPTATIGTQTDTNKTMSLEPMPPLASEDIDSSGPPTYSRWRSCSLYLCATLLGASSVALTTFAFYSDVIETWRLDHMFDIPRNAVYV